MPQISAAPIFSFCMILLTLGIIYNLYDGRIDIEFLKFKITGKGDKK
jgi:hypothetical protein